MTRRILWNILALLAALLPGMVAAQGGELSFDAPVEATLQRGAPHTYTFASAGEDAISVWMEALTEGLDPVLVLFDPVGGLLAFNDDIAFGERDAALTDVRLTAPGVYTLVARSYGNRGAGAYTLRATSRRAETLAESAPILPGATVQAELAAAGQVDRWWFEARAGQVISARMDADPGTALDPVLELLAADGTLLAASDDEGGAPNSLINGFALPADGRYVLQARAWGNATAGGYSLHLAEGVLAPGAPRGSPPG